MAGLRCLCSFSLTQRFSPLSNARLISFVTLRSREYPELNKKDFPVKPKTSAILYCLEKRRKHVQSAGSDDGSAFSLVRCMKEWTTLTDSEKKPYVDQQRLLSQEYKEYKKSLSKEERADMIARWKGHFVQRRKKKQVLSQWKKDRQENAGVPKKLSGTTLFTKEKLPDMYIDHGNAKEAFKAVAMLWNDLDEDTKMRYKELARLQFENDVREYQKTHPGFLPMVKKEVPKKVTGMNIFTKERLPSIMHRDSVTAREAMKSVTEEWIALSEEEKKEYGERADAAYNEAVEKFVKTHPTFTPTTMPRPRKRKKTAYSIFVKEALRSDPDANSEDVLVKWNKLSKNDKWYYNMVAEIQYNRRRKKYLKASGLQF